MIHIYIYIYIYFRRTTSPPHDHSTTSPSCVIVASSPEIRPARLHRHRLPEISEFSLSLFQLLPHQAWTCSRRRRHLSRSDVHLRCSVLVQIDHNLRLFLFYFIISPQSSPLPHQSSPFRDFSSESDFSTSTQSPSSNIFLSVSSVCPLLQ
ncbi:hypothetical protein YC2023_016598 [Brassica napus]